MLGIAIPSEASTKESSIIQKQAIAKRFEEEIDLDPLVLESKQLLRDKIGFVFSMKKYNDELFEIAKMPALRKSEKEKLIR